MVQIPPQSAESLEKIAQAALSGDEAAESRLFQALRVRFIQIAKRRVRDDHVEDVVHDTLNIVLTKYRDREGDSGILVWSLTVLRNVIGNYYQARKRTDDRQQYVEDWQTLDAASEISDPTIVMEAEELADRLNDAVARLARKSMRCGRIFAGLSASLQTGGGQREISSRALALVQKDFPEMTRNTFYVALHRCRAQLRLLLDKTEASPA
jgi:RNA polymerase sigma factor (sigma-70 family)